MLGTTPAKSPRTGSASHYNGDNSVLLRVTPGHFRVGSVTSAIASVLGHYWGAHSGFKNWFVGDEAVNGRNRSWGEGEAPRAAFHSGECRQPDVEVFSELIRWTFAFGFDE